MRNSRSDILPGALLALILFLFYISLLSQAYVFEGLVRAMPIETGRWGHLFAGNYLLYGPLGLVFHTLLRSLGFLHPAVVSLQIMDAGIGATGIIIFYLTLRRLGGSVFSALVWSTVLAGCLGYGMWSTDAEDYILSTVLLLTNFYFLVRYFQQGGDPVALGALHGLAILAHIVNGLFGLVGIWFLVRKHGRRWRMPVLKYVAASACVAVTAYAGVLFFIQKPATFHAALMWIEGSAGVWSNSLDMGGVLNQTKLGQWLKMSLHIFTSFAPPYDNPPGWAVAPICLWGAWILLAIFAGFVLARFEKIYRKQPVVVGGCLIWLVAYAVIFIRWQPWIMVYRVSDLIPLCLLLFLGYQDVAAGNRIGRGAAGLLAFCLLAGNGGAELYPRSQAGNNTRLTRMAFLKANTGEEAWITGSDQDEIYIPYFAQRRPIIVARYAAAPDQLVEGLNHLQAEGQTLFVTSSVLDVPLWRTIFSRYTLTLKARDEHGFALYQVGKYHS